MNATSKWIAAISLLVFAVAGASSCAGEPRRSPQSQVFDINSIKSYRDIPGVTEDEIRAIEALKAARAEFVYGSMPSTEAFTLPDGKYAGFTTKFCGLLSELFGVPFVQELYAWKELKEGIDDKSIDFTGELTPTPERLLNYSMTYPIAERGLGVFTRDDFAKIKSAGDLKGLKTGFYAGTITAGSIFAAYPELNLDIVDVYNESDVNEKLSTGAIDVFIADATEALTYSDDFISHKNIFPLIYTPVSLTSANPELTPVISVVNKYITAGGIDRLTELYKEGSREYARFEFYRTLTEGERAYLDGLTANSAKVPVALESDNYPISFYNNKDRAFQGIAPDILDEIARLTGIEFENVAEPNEAWITILEKLETGAAIMVSELLFTEERRDKFLWPENHYAVNRYALISKHGYPPLEAYQVARATVGIVSKTSREDVYRRLFPNNDNIKYYVFQNEAFGALERGEIDLMMSSEYEFLILTNYLENSGYKINLVFNSPLVESFFGFNKNEETLCSVMSKAALSLDTGKIEREWVNRTFDYEKKLAVERSYYANQRSVILAVFSGLLLLLLIALSILLMRNIRARNTIEIQTSVISAIYNALPDMVFTKDTKGTYTSINRSFERLMGSDTPKTAGKNFRGLFESVESEDVSSRVAETDQKVITENCIVRVEEQGIFPDGARRFLEIVKTPLNKDGKVIGLLGIVRDITEHKELLEKTKDLSEYELMKYTLTNNALGIGLWDMEVVADDPVNPENKFTWSQELRKMLGFEDKNDFPNLLNSWSDRIHPDDKENVLAAFHKHLVDRSGNTPYDVEYRMMLKNGTYRYFRALGATQRDDTGLPLRVAGALEDINDKRQMQAELAGALVAELEANRLKNVAINSLEKILNSMDTMIHVSIPNTGEILFMNDSMKRHYNVEGDCLGQKCYEVLKADKDEICDFCPCFQLDKEPDKAVVWEEHNALTNRIYHNVDRYIDWPNGQSVHMQNSVDITELAAAKDLAEQSNRSKSIFLAQMSHEIRTPMTAILGAAEIQLQKKTFSPDTEEAFNTIYNSGILLLQIIDDILDLSKIEAGRLELVPAKYDIPSLVNDAVHLNCLRYERKPLDFKLLVDENTPLELIGDELRIRQILNNLLSNAFKYTERGEVKMSVGAEPARDDETVTLVFRVSDTGQGMRKDQIDRIFEEYSRFNMETNHGVSGTGLGMSITKRLIDMMNGEILIESEAGRGSVFTVRLPQKRCGSVVCGAELAENLRNFNFSNALISQKANIVYEPMPYARVLVVDDVEFNLYVAEGLLAPYGLYVETAMSGLEAVDKIKNGGEYDIVFMDHMMPRMDGVKATKILRDMGYSRPVIALTANVLVGQAEMYLSNGFDGFLAKPIDSLQLDVLLTAFIRDKKPPEVVGAARREQKETQG